MKRERPYIIAEVGFNHEGNMETARRMIRAAAEAGADAVKFQTFDAGDLVLPSSEHYELIKPAEMTLAEMKQLKDWADEDDIDFLSTPFSGRAVQWLVEVGAPAIKVASMDCTNHMLLAEVAATGLPVLLSTGMATLDEIGASLAFLEAHGADEVVLLHCISNYPAKADELNLAMIPLLEATFQRAVGYSDHHDAPEACLVAAIMGAEVIETHFTIEPEREDGDHGHSIGPEDLRLLLARMDEALAMLGDRAAAFDRPDRCNAPLFRRGVYAARDLAAGQRIGVDDLLAVRPANALAPADIPALRGKRLLVDIPRHTALGRQDVENDG